MDVNPREMSAAYLEPPKTLSDKVFLLALLERAFRDLKLQGYYKRTAISWFLEAHPCCPPNCIPFKTIISELDLSTDRVNYLIENAQKADRGEDV